jgi:nicotinamide phosphoribosyltransferase
MSTTFFKNEEFETRPAAEFDWNPILDTDLYKFVHALMYPDDVDFMYYTWTPRDCQYCGLPGVDHAIFFGLQGSLNTITNDFSERFFSQPAKRVVKKAALELYEITRKVDPDLDISQIERNFKALHELGYLPIRVDALKEGSFVPMGVPMFTVSNTVSGFGWVPGYLETLISNTNWQSTTAATIADCYYRILMKWAKKTSDHPEAIFNQAGDFSMRGLTDPRAATRVGAAHLTSFGVTSTVSSGPYAKAFYGAAGDVNTYGVSVEHSVTESYGSDFDAVRALLKKFPTGNITVVADTWDLEKFITEVMVAFKDEIMTRDGKFSPRPDSGDPVKILCGDPKSDNEFYRKGVVEVLYEIFGGTVNRKGYKVLDPHIGVTYGDSIAPTRADEILRQLEAKGFASTNVVFGIGSYTYQFMTRDNFGFGYKATAIIIAGAFKAIFKDPKTVGSGLKKKSQKGLVAVVIDDKTGDLRIIDQLTPETYPGVVGNLLRPVYVNGKFVDANYQTFPEIRRRVREESRRIYGEEIAA